MRRLLVLAMFIPATLLARSRYGDNNMSVTTNDGTVTGCSDLRVTIDGEPAARAEEVVNVGSPRSLAVHAARNGGIYVTGDSARYEVTACKAGAVGSSLSDIRVNMSGNELSATGPENDRWMVYFIVKAPRGAELNLDATNGPIGLRNVSGTIGARAVNGPISARQIDGTINLETTNGPITIDGGSGTAKANATNGPITVRLRDAWNGTLDAHTENGPMSLKISSNFRSGVVVESDGHGPVSCKADACREARRTWSDEDNRRIELGSGPTAVHLSTNNGPVSVRSIEDFE